MRRSVRIRFWIEVALASLTAGLSVLTLISRGWIELVLGSIQTVAMDRWNAATPGAPRSPRQGSNPGREISVDELYR